MLLHRKLTLSLALLGLALSAPRAEAVQVIDSFNGPPDVSAPDTDAIDVLEPTTRETTITAGTMTSSLGNLTVIGTGAVGTITWTPDDGGFDLSPNDRFALDVLGTVIGSWTATIFADDGTNTDSVDFAGSLASGTAFLPFSLFDNGTVDTSDDVNFATLTEIRLTLTDVPNSEIMIGELRAVPEPSTAGMFLLGLFGLARIGRGRNSLS